MENKESTTRENDRNPVNKHIKEAALAAVLFLTVVNTSPVAAEPLKDNPANVLPVASVTSVEREQSALVRTEPLAVEIIQNERYFSETGFTATGVFYQRWLNNGGLEINGYPISSELMEVYPDGRKRVVQYFERGVFEYFPENPDPFKVQLRLLGVGNLAERYNGNIPIQKENNDKNSLTFKETTHIIGGKFKDYWVNNGGLSQFGFPITGEFYENGKLVQYFERARLELHPENAGTRYEIQGGFFGADEMHKKYPYELPVSLVSDKRLGFSLDKSGIGLDKQQETSIENFIISNESSYLDWGSRGGKIGKGEYLVMLGAFRSMNRLEIIDSANDFLKYVSEHKESFPQGTKIIIGNEIGLDDGRSAEDYVQEFSIWYELLSKQGFNVGLGANYSPFFKFEKNKPAECIQVNPMIKKEELLGINNSGLKNFKDILVGLQNKGITPDFISQHAYPGWCNGVESVEHFKSIITLYRQVMKDLNIAHLPFILTEYTLQDFNNTYTEKQKEDYMRAATTIIKGYTDVKLGNPIDGYRMVQHADWFVGNEKNNYDRSSEWWKNIALLDRNGNLTLLGMLYLSFR